MVPVGSYSGGSFWGYLREPFSGAWQKNVEALPTQNILAFSAVYACVSLIAEDIAKLRPKLVQITSDGTWVEAPFGSPFWAGIGKPNRYQTRVQFLSQWMTSKLLYGNTYILKEREPNRGMVRNLYPLDPRKVVPLVADDGSVWYQLNADYLTGVQNAITVPAEDIIHDRGVTLFHPLIGVSPIYACGVSATQGVRIQANSESFFRNMSRPSGQLSAPGTIPPLTAERLKRDFEANFTDGNIGRIFVAGDGLKYEPFGIPAEDAQLIQQLAWTVQDIARCFRVPLHKISGTENPKFTNMAALNQDYYTQTLQSHIEAIEILLDEGLGLPTQTMGVELDLDGLLRMDPGSQAAANKDGVLGGWMTPNEARAKFNLPPIKGGNTAYLQQQNYSLAALDKRDSLANPFQTTPTPPALPPPAEGKAFRDFMTEAEEFAAEIRKGLIDA